MVPVTVMELAPEWDLGSLEPDAAPDSYVVRVSEQDQVAFAATAMHPDGSPLNLAF